MEAATEPLVSVVVPTYNSAAVVGACLDALARQTCTRVEVIVVDQSSTDGTRDIARAAGAAVLSRPAPLFYSPPTSSRNAGAEFASAAIVYHLDSDMAPESHLLQEAVDIFASQPDTVALVVPEVDVAGGFWSQCKGLERRCYWGDPAVESARIVRRATFDLIGGYDESLGAGEDFDLHRRLQRQGLVGRTHASVQHDLRQLHFRRSIRKKYDYGKTARTYLDKHGATGFGIARTQLGAFVRHRAELRRQPLMTLGMLAMKASEMAAGLAGDVVVRSTTRPRARN